LSSNRTQISSKPEVLRHSSQQIASEFEEQSVEPISRLRSLSTSQNKFNSDSELEIELSSDQEEIDYANEDEVEDIPSWLENIRISQDFIREIREATLDNGKLDEGAIHWLQNPSLETFDLKNPDICLSVDLYMSCMNSSK